jgi:hypothetical protein
MIGVGRFPPMAIQRKNHLTVRARLKLVLPGKTAANVLVIVYFTVDSEDLFTVR